MQALDSEGHPHPLDRCGICSTVQACEQPSDEALRAFYSRYSYEQEGAWDLSPATAASLRAVAEILAPYRATNRLLDIGCGTGVLLRAMQRHGWSVEGTELSVAAGRRLRTEGFVIHDGPLMDLRLAPATYDVVVMTEVIEHLRDPANAAATARLLLRPGGCLYLTTPNADSLARRLLGNRWRAVCFPDHLFYFSRRAIATLLREAGFTRVDSWTEGVNPFELLMPLRSGTGDALADATARGQSLRAASAGSGTLAAAKQMVNLGLRWFSMGDTLKVLAETPHAAEDSAEST
jgi:SAM-dependent methyltransferase